MKVRIRSVLIVFFAVLTLTVGTGIVMAQAYKIPSSSYQALGLAAILNHNPGSSYNSKSTTTSNLLTSQDTTGSDLLNLVQPTKESVQAQINEGFSTWMQSSLERWTSSLNADNETVSKLFFQFLSDNPTYLELFKLYDQLLSDEIGADMSKFSNETSDYMNLVLSEGNVIKEWNTTEMVNGTNYTYITQDYALDINGTTQHVLKMSVYDSNGTLILDPYLLIAMAPLYYWLPWPWSYPILYGYDFGAWLHLNPTETLIYINNAYIALLYNVATCTFNQIASYISPIALAFDLIALKFPPAAIPGLVLSATALILAGLGKAVEAVAHRTWEDIEFAFLFNEAIDPSYGFTLFQRFHWVASYVFWDPWTWTQFYFILANGIMFQTASATSVIYIFDWLTVDAYLAFLTWYAFNVGFYHIVWFGPYGGSGGAVTTLSLNGTQGLNGWYTSDVTVNISTAGVVSDVAKTEYGFDDTNWVTYTGPFNITTEGITTLYYRLTDNEGHVVEANSTTIMIDKTPPETTVSLSGTLGLNGWYTSDVATILSATDDVSGVNKIEYSFDGGNWVTYTGPFTITTEGVTFLYYRSADNAGIMENTSIEIIKVDKTPPETMISLSGTLGQGGWYTSDVNVNLTATDNISGVAMTEYSFDDTNWVTYTGSFNITTEGITTLYYRSTDVAGYVENTNTEIIMVDKTPPVTNLTIGTPIYVDSGGNVYVTSATNFTLTASDFVSSVAYTYYRINGGDWIEYTGAFNITDPIKTYTIDYYSVDVAGNSEPVNSKTVILEEEFHGWALLLINGKLFMGDANLFHSEHLIRVEVGGQIATWNTTRQIVIHCDNGSLELYWGKSAIGGIFLMIHRGETSTHVLAAGRGVFFTSHTCPNMSHYLEEITLELY